jgi:hypothetical protein
MKRIYIAGPISKGDLGRNIAQAIEAGDMVASLDCAPFIPHLTVFWQMMSASAGRAKGYLDYDFWLGQDFAWLSCCHALLRLAGESKGADLEIVEADRLGIPVFYSMEALEAWLKSQV